MKLSAALVVLLAGVAPQGTDAVQASRLRATQGRAEALASSGSSASAAAAFESKLGAGVMLAVRNMLMGKGGGPTEIAHKMMDKISVTEAMQRLSGRLPSDVASLVSMSAQGTSKGQFDEESLQKARGILNNMMSDAWKELDDIIFECKEFQERNRGTYEQVVTDISRLGSQLARLSDKRVESSECIMEQDRMRKEVEKDIDDRTTQFKAKRTLDDAEMTIRRNDLAVFDMILQMTRCPDSTAFAQIGSQRTTVKSGLSFAAKSNSNHGLKVCEARDGQVHLVLPDPKTEARIEKMMTPEARKALRAALGLVNKKSKVSFLELGTETNEQQPVLDVASVNTTTAYPTYAAETLPVIEEPHPDGQWKKCVDGPPNCGLLHDLMSMEWGKFRDSFDELATEMEHDQSVFDRYMGDMNEQLATINDGRTKCMETLAETISEINADTEEMNEKDDQKRDLQGEYDRTMKRFREACEEILYTRICGVRKVRNQLMWDSTVSPPSKISDCDFTDWYPKDGICIGVSGTRIECDDTCPQADPYACGGLEMMTRDVVVSPNEYGMVCPQLERQKKCKQIKCPVDCVMSEWSGWSRCSKDCEGGIELRTRSILTKAKNGGRSCDTVQEEQSCNTGSCDRNCRLDSWTEWSPCSMACGGGVTQRTKRILIPTRGRGRCPREKSRRRWEEEECNTQECVGDEICIAHQDLVLTVDGSGSLRQSGFETVRAFAVNVTLRYQSQYYGNEDMKVGLVEFGNGHLIEQGDGTTNIAEALYVAGLTSDLEYVKNQVESLQWLQGFTNMAQAFHTADVMLGQGGREDAQSAILMISDGKYSMGFQTAEKAQELKDKNVMIYLVAITETRGAELRGYRRLASFPRRSNFVRVPGLEALHYNSDLFTGRIIAKFCPHAFSPSQEMQKEEEQEYMMIHESGYPSDSCGAWAWHGFGFTVETCMQNALQHETLGFSFGTGCYMAGGCYSEAMQVDMDFWNANLNSRRNPPCPNGWWVRNPYFDTWIIKPTDAHDFLSTTVR